MCSREKINGVHTNNSKNCSHLNTGLIIFEPSCLYSAPFIYRFNYLIQNGIYQEQQECPTFDKDRILQLVIAPVKSRTNSYRLVLPGLLNHFSSATSFGNCQRSVLFYMYTPSLVSGRHQFMLCVCT